MHGDWEYDDPVVDSEMGSRHYTVRRLGREVTFAIHPVDGPDGESGWVMKLGADRVISPGTPDFEPYDTPEEAYEAGLRAAREALNSPA